MSEEGSCQFRLREDMPRGFIENEQYPELPAIHKYLGQHDGNSFSSPEEFKQKVLVGLLPYLERQAVPTGGDPKLREGLQLERLPEKDERFGWDYFVYTPATNGPGQCVFGGLELITEH
jgi:hypothetical protein